MAEIDLIRRRDALDLVCTQWREHTEPTKRYEMLAEALEEIVFGLKEMSSAESEIIRCKDCKSFEECDKVMFWYGEDDFCSRAERKGNG